MQRCVLCVCILFYFILFLFLIPPERRLCIFSLFSLFLYSPSTPPPQKKKKLFKPSSLHFHLVSLQILLLAKFSSFHLPLHCRVNTADGSPPFLHHLYPLPCTLSFSLWFSDARIADQTLIWISTCKPMDKRTKFIYFRFKAFFSILIVWNTILSCCFQNFEKHKYFDRFNCHFLTKKVTEPKKIKYKTESGELEALSNGSL